VYILLSVKGQSERSITDQCTIVAASCACGNLRRATRAVTQLYAKIMESSGLQPTQFTLLVACAVAGSVPITVLADALVMDRTTLTRNIKLLTKQGLVRVVEGDDRRVRIVELSREGRNALARALSLWEKAQARMVEGLGQARLDSLLKDLSAVVELTRVP